MMPDVLVNNAGVAHYELFTDVTEEDWDHVINVNLKGPFLCTQAFVPHMIAQKYGRMTNCHRFGESAAPLRSGLLLPKGA